MNKVYVAYYFIDWDANNRDIKTIGVYTSLEQAIEGCEQTFQEWIDDHRGVAMTYDRFKDEEVPNYVIIDTTETSTSWKLCTSDIVRGYVVCTYELNKTQIFDT